MDSSEPSTNGASASNLYRLSSSLSDEMYAQKAKETVGSFESEMLQYPWLFASFMPSIVARHLGLKSVILGGSTDTEAQNFAKELRGGLGTIVRPDNAVTWLRERNTYLKDFALDGKMRILICENGVCREETATGSNPTAQALDLGAESTALPTPDAAGGSGTGGSGSGGPTDVSAPGTESAKSL
jgi:uncharacterized protein YyaL (SSP411 family)